MNDDLKKKKNIVGLTKPWGGVNGVLLVFLLHIAVSGLVEDGPEHFVVSYQTVFVVIVVVYSF